MNEPIIPKLQSYDAATLDEAFGELESQVKEESVMLVTEDGRHFVNQVGAGTSFRETPR